MGRDVTITFDPFIAGCLLIVTICALLVLWMDRWDKARRPPKDETERMAFELAKSKTLPELVPFWVAGWIDHAAGRQFEAVVHRAPGHYQHGVHAPDKDDIIKRAAYDNGYRASRDRHGYFCP